jgi:tetratricopeptide (TPR) repeat protein
LKEYFPDEVEILGPSGKRINYHHSMTKINLNNEISTTKQDQAGLWKEKGDAFVKLGNYKAAIDCYNSGIEFDPTNWKIWNNKGLCLFKLGRKEEAENCKEKIQELKTDLLPENEPPLIDEPTKIKEQQITPITIPTPPIPLTTEEPQFTDQEKTIETPPTSAHVYGISGSTHHLLKGMQPINGKKITNLEEIIQFYNNYEKILQETEITVRKQQDEEILNTSNQETMLDAELKEGLARKTREVYKTISELETKIQGSRNIFAKLKYQFQYWKENRMRTNRINSQFSGDFKELNNVRIRRSNLIANEEKVIQNECNKVRDSFQFLEQNKPFLIGAQGEELVIGHLSQLPNEYHVFNDVNLHFRPVIYWKEKNDYIISSQIDHLVIGPTGVFLIETKNWKSSDIDVKSGDLVFQVRRSSYALWRYLNQYYRRDPVPTRWNVIVSTQGYHSDQKLDKFIDVISPGQLSWYITQRKSILSSDGINRAVNIIQKCH